ncbi:unnamed protein product [Cylindrotheca closterium]|uniref:SET domain-containing protein n=1 Tax=Cylindrotheca closterium TaxID=2856 RepID=A0AAD2CYK8_9STRA|nr:unnamed protein product [Cylindrotheca closterium]
MATLRRFSVGVATLLLTQFSHSQDNANENDILVVDSQNSTAQTPESDQCRIWVGMSTIPGAGLGMFAGKDFDKGELLLPVGDLVIPIVDLGTRRKITFLWNDYTWASHSGYYGATKMAAHETDMASPGFGAVANGYMDFLNVDQDGGCEYGPEELDRLRDPEAGAFSLHHSRMSHAGRKVAKGEELFNNYGNKWFKQRQYKLGVIPLWKDHKRAESLYKKFSEKLLSKYEDSSLSSVVQDLWATFVTDEKNTWQSTVFAALPPKEDYQQMEKLGLKQLKRSQMTRSQDWLDKHALCADNFEFGVSTIPKAGHGLFASRYLSEGSAILPVPLIHIPERSVLTMRQPRKLIDMGHKHEKFTRQQLLLNYCLGHVDSTLVLSPYGPSFGLINHNQTRANVRLQWAKPERSNHFPEALEKDVKWFTTEKGSRLGMEVITLRDIEPGEEILLDYGDDWEKAWREHKAKWRPLEKSLNYVSAYEMNRRQNSTLKTVFEEIKEPYPSNIVLGFREEYNHTGPWRNANETGTDNFFFKEGLSDMTSCEILRREEMNGQTLYAAVLADRNNTDKNVLLEHLLREAFEFSDAPYTTDVFLRNAFRHEIRIPDDMFPEAWKNLREASDFPPPNV